MNAGSWFDSITRSATLEGEYIYRPEAAEDQLGKPFKCSNYISQTPQNPEVDFILNVEIFFLVIHWL